MCVSVTYAKRKYIAIIADVFNSCEAMLVCVQLPSYIDMYSNELTHGDWVDCSLQETVTMTKLAMGGVYVAENNVYTHMHACTHAADELLSFFSRKPHRLFIVNRCIVQRITQPQLPKPGGFCVYIVDVN